MILSAKTIAGHLGGEIIGNPEATASTVARIESGKSGSLCFLANPKYEQYLYTCKASIILVNRSFELKQAIEPTVIKVDNAYEAIASLLDLLNNMKAAQRKGRSWSACISWRASLGKGVYVGPKTVIEKKARIGKNTQIYPQVWIGANVSIGEDCIIYPGVKIYPGCKIGNRCILHSGCIIGADGFGFAPTADGSYKKIPQTGIVTLEDDVEVGANTTIDRSTMGTTLIRKGAKIDNLVMIAHNVEIGSNTVIAAQTGIAGSTHVGGNCMFGGQVGIAGHLEIADNTKLAAQSGVISSIKEPGATMMGSPAFEHRLYLKAYTLFRAAAKRK